MAGARPAARFASKAGYLRIRNVAAALFRAPKDKFFKRIAIASWTASPAPNDNRKSPGSPPWTPALQPTVIAVHHGGVEMDVGAWLRGLGLGQSKRRDYTGGARSFDRARAAASLRVALRPPADPMDQTPFANARIQDTATLPGFDACSRSRRLFPACAAHRGPRLDTRAGMTVVLYGAANQPAGRVARPGLFVAALLAMTIQCDRMPSLSGRLPRSSRGGRRFSLAHDRRPRALPPARASGALFGRRFGFGAAAGGGFGSHRRRRFVVTARFRLEARRRFGLHAVRRPCLVRDDGRRGLGGNGRCRLVGG